MGKRFFSIVIVLVVFAALGVCVAEVLATPQMALIFSGMGLGGY
jgi:hypothetical protein